MALSGTVRGHLLAYAPLVAQVGTRIYPIVFPPNPTLPVMTYRILGGPLEQTHDDPDSGPLNPRIQLTAFATTKSTVETIIRLAMQAMSTFPGGASISGPIDDYNDQTKLYQESCDVQLLISNPLV